MRILLIDDQAHVLRVIKLSLDRNGFDVDTADSGDTAVSMLRTSANGKGKLRQSAYDVIITDADMPGMHGTELCEAILRDFNDNPPLMFIVGDSADRQLAEWAARRPAIEVLEQPMSLAHLMDRIDEHFGQFEKIAASR